MEFSLRLCFLEMTEAMPIKSRQHNCLIWTEQGQEEVYQYEKGKEH